MAPVWTPKQAQDSPKTLPKGSQVSFSNLLEILGISWGCLGLTSGLLVPSWVVFGLFWGCQERPRWAKMLQHDPKIAQSCSQKAPKKYKVAGSASTMPPKKAPRRP